MIWVVCFCIGDIVENFFFRKIILIGYSKKMDGVKGVFCVDVYVFFFVVVYIKR